MYLIFLKPKSRHLFNHFSISLPNILNLDEIRHGQSILLAIYGNDQLTHLYTVMDNL